MKENSDSESAHEIDLKVELIEAKLWVKTLEQKQKTVGVTAQL